MQRGPRAWAAGLVAMLSLVLSSACAPKLDELGDTRSTRGSLGEEVYKVLCRRVAGTELPNDTTGDQTDQLCLGSADQVASAMAAHGLPARLVTLARRRAELVAAIDDVFGTERADPLQLLMQKMLPFYDAPEERIQKGTRALAAWLERVAGDEAALAGLEALGRDGMAAPEGVLGSYRALLGDEALRDVFAKALPVLTKDARSEAGLRTVLTGMALELATIKTDAKSLADLNKLTRLLHREIHDLPGLALRVAIRDARGFPVPDDHGSGALPYPFVDANHDGLADVVHGTFASQPAFAAVIPAPFRVPGEQDVARDDVGQAFAFLASGGVDREHTLFATRELHGTVLGAAVPEAAKLFSGDIATQLARVAPALFGPQVNASKTYGKGSFAYQAPDVAKSPLVDLAYASAALVEEPAYDDSLLLTKQIIQDHETEWVQSLAPLLTLEQHTRAGQDDYPDAQLKKHNIFWDELLYQAERMSRRRRTQDGETTLEAVLRAALGFARNLSKPGAPIERLVPVKTLQHQGAVLSALMRFKDDWRANPKGESKRAPGEDVVRGSFLTTVDRAQPDLPVTCGKDGCGGLLAGSPFEDWLRKTAQQKCTLGNEGRSGTDCGSAGNQSIYQRSLGLIWEMAGRSQTNKKITVGDLLDFAVLVDPCENLDPAVACTGATDAAKNASCATAYASSDYSCDLGRNVCIATRDSATCVTAKQAQAIDRQNSIDLAEDAVAKDYTCPASEGSAACHAIEATYPAAFIMAAGDTEAAIQEGHLLDMPDVGRSFGRALTHEFVLEVPNPWVRRYLEDIARAADTNLSLCDPGDIDDPTQIPHRNSDNVECVPNAARLSRDVYKDMPSDVDTLGELIEFLLDDSTLFAEGADTDALRPDVKALSRVLFAPPGSSSFIVFDPLLVQHAPLACSAAPTGTKPCAMIQGELDAKACCIADVKKPPLRYRLDTFYGATTFSWEHEFKFKDGTQLSFLDSMKTLGDAVNRTDYRPEDGDNPADFESTDFIFSTLGKVVAEHYDSSKNPLAQSKNPQGMHYRKLSNLVSYEAMVADALDDGMVADAQVDTQTFSKASQRLGMALHALPLLSVLDDMEFDGARDGLDVLSDVAELTLSAHAHCAGATGDRRVLNHEGACDHALAGEPGFITPLTYRDGRSTICWENGSCFDKPGARRYATPLYLLLDAWGGVDDRIAGDEAQKTALDLGTGGLLDAYLAHNTRQLLDRRLVALLLTLIDHTRERWAEEHVAGKLASLRTDLTSDVSDAIHGPVVAGGVAMLETLLSSDEALQALSAFAFALLDEEKHAANQRALLAGLDDYLQSMPGTEQTRALYRALSDTILPDTRAVLAGGKVGALDAGVTWQNLLLLRDTAKLDASDALAPVLNHVAHVPEGVAQRGSPAQVLLAVLTDINRVEPGASTPLSHADFKAVLTRIADVLKDDERGFERLYRIISCREGGVEARGSAREQDQDCN